MTDTITIEDLTRMQAQVREFMAAFGQPLRDLPVTEWNQMPEQTRQLAVNLLSEEYLELYAAVEAADPVETADAIGDSLYVAMWALNAFGYTVLQVPQGGNRLGKNPGDIGMPWGPGVEWFNYVFDPANPNNRSNPQDHLPLALGEYIASLAKLTGVFEYPIIGLFNEIHRSNMSKLGADGKPVYRESDRKVLKGPGYSKPDIAGVLAKYRNEKPA